MAVALGCSLLASVLCLRSATGPWRSRLHHLLPTPLMALGTGHAGLQGGLLAAVAAAAGLWVLGVVLARRFRAGRGGQPALRADATDAFAMAVALVAPALVSAATGAPAQGVAGHADHADHGGHAGGAVGASLTAGSAGPALLGVVAAALVVTVVLARLGVGARGPRPAVSRTLPPALLMAASLVLMVAT